MIKWGVLGTAGIARRCTIPGMKEAVNCELYAIAGRDKDKVKEFKDSYGFQVSYVGYEELLADDNVQAVYIPLPNQLHYEWVMKAIDAGKHVLCEKPLAPTAKEAEELFAAAKAKGVVLMEAFAYLHSPYIDLLKADISSGRIGEVNYIDAAFLTSGYSLSNIRMQKDCYGGATYDLGCYCTSMILRLLDKEPNSIKAVADYSAEGIDVLTTAIMDFGDGVRASMTCGMNLEKDKDYRLDRLFIRGSKGYILSDVEFNQSGRLEYILGDSEGIETRAVTVDQNYRIEVEQLGRCITDGDKPHVSEDFTVLNARVLDRILNKIGY